MNGQRPILYSFRRCPYAMRGRMALKTSGVAYEHREILLRDKPDAMLAASPKGTVPVIVLADGEVIEESLDVMRWALAQNDPESWLAPGDAMFDLIAENDGPFKHHLDRYKYSNRYEDAVAAEHREAGLDYLNKLNDRLAGQAQLFGDEVSLADIVLSGGEPAALAILDACIRLLPGVMGAPSSGHEESFEDGLLEYPQYTRPQEWEGRTIPEVLRSGDHAKVVAWRKAQAEETTRLRRPDLWERYSGDPVRSASGAQSKKKEMDQ